MQHRVTNNLVLRASASATNPTREWSKAVGLGQDNTAMFEVWLRSNSQGVVPTVRTSIQGSNNLDEWKTLATTSFALSPGYKKVDVSGVIPWAFLRLKYEAFKTGATPNVMIAGTITTFQQTT